MEDFTFFSPTEILFGKDTEKHVGTILHEFSNKILVVTSFGATNSSGVADRALKSLDEAKIEYITLTGIKANPTTKKVYEGIEIVKQNDINFILAIGGGSIIDTAKAIAVGALYDGDIWELFTSKKIFDRAIPIGAILTIAAAGSELSDSCIITNEEQKLKTSIKSDLIRPIFAILNPEVTLTLPEDLTFAGVADMLIHIIERYITPTKNVDFTDRLAEGAMKSIIYNGIALKENLSDINLRAEIMLAGAFAHNGIFGMGRAQEWAAHNLGHAISAIYDITHGKTLTVMTPAWMKYIINDNLDKFVQFANRVFDVEADSKEETAKEGIRRLELFFERIGMPTRLGQLGIPTGDADLEELADTFGKVAPKGSSKAIYRDDALKIYNIAK